MISIRDIVQADIPACTGLINAVIEEGLLTWQSARTEGDNTAWLSTLQAQRYPFLVAYNADQLVGIGALEWYWDPEPGSGVEYTCSIFVAVDAGHRRKGIATSLFQKLQGHESTAARQLYLCMRTMLSINTAAKSWLLKMGFHHCGSLTDIATRAGSSCNEEFYGFYFGSAPNIAGRGFPDKALFRPLPKKHFNLPLDLDKVIVRQAKLSDITSITDIRNEAVQYLTAISNTEPCTNDENLRWLRSLLEESLPCVVAEVDGLVVGYCCFGKYGEDACFKNCLEVSIYIRQDLTRQQLGPLMFKACVGHSAMRERGIKTLLASIAATNSYSWQAALEYGAICQVTRARIWYKFGEFGDAATFKVALEQ